MTTTCTDNSSDERPTILVSRQRETALESIVGAASDLTGTGKAPDFDGAADSLAYALMGIGLQHLDAVRLDELSEAIAKAKGRDMNGTN